MSENSFLWHDFETFGADPRRDRPAQFAALRTDAELRPIEDPMVIYCQPGDDVLPQPAACLITGITPQEALERGLPEPAFAEQIHRAMSRAGTCTVGYNNFRFDDEVTRFLFWRNFYDPYAREYSNGNSRFDLIDLMRMTRALRPDGLEWPKREDGTPSFRLEDLASANGMDTSRAHDALADVEATLGMAQRVREHQPRLWNWALSLRQKHRVGELLEPRTPLLHSTSRFPAAHCGTSVVLPLAPHPQFSGQWILWDLRHAPDEFEDLSVDDLADRLWVSSKDLPEGMNRLPVKLIRANRCPMLSPMSVMDDAAEARLAIDRAALNRHEAALNQRPDLINRIVSLFQPNRDGRSGMDNDPEQALYDGFVPRSDSSIYPRIRQASGEDLARLGSPFQDERLNTLLFRFRARHHREALDDEELQRWQDYRRRRLLDDPDLASITAAQFDAEIQQRLDQASGDQSEIDILNALIDWRQSMNLVDLG
ncbi:MAG: exodeoxyribonuclease I [Pseudomonadota bacterium]